jgi:hypothetical protein
VAKRRQPPVPVVELPEHLRRDAVRVEDFVPWEEPVSSVGEDPPYLAFRRLRAWRRWQDAVTAGPAPSGAWTCRNCAPWACTRFSRRGSGTHPG